MTPERLRAARASLEAERRSLAEQRCELAELRARSRELEIMGRVSTGVAHDFKNLLAGISGCAQIALDDWPADNSRDMVEMVCGAARRGVELVDQLLTVARGRPEAPEVLSINRMVEESAGILSRLLGEDVELRLELDPGLPRVLADHAQVRQVVWNLVMNAGEAISGSGYVTIASSLENVVDASQLASGRYAVLAVSDTGHGLDAETARRVFDPHFTTKPGSGHGVGLSTVRAIAEEFGGQVAVESHLGAGSVFRVFIPGTDLPLVEEDPDFTYQPRGAGRGRVLVVSGDPMLRLAALHCLERAGFDVVPAANGGEALAADLDGVTAIVADARLPGPLSARGLIELLQGYLSGLAVVFLSSQPAEAMEGEGRANPAHVVVGKPFGRRELVAAVESATASLDPRLSRSPV